MHAGKQAGRQAGRHTHTHTHTHSLTHTHSHTPHTHAHTHTHPLSLISCRINIPNQLNIENVSLNPFPAKECVLLTRPPTSTHHPKEESRTQLKNQPETFIL